MIPFQPVKTGKISDRIARYSLVAEATHNPVITLTMNPIFDILKEMNLEIKGKRLTS